MSQSTHYHIKWLPTGKLDWQPFTAQDDAEQMARELQLREEEYLIEMIEGQCEGCADLNPHATSPADRKERNH